MLYILGMFTKNCNLKNNKEEILEAIETILQPIAHTMSPRGSNVLMRDDKDNPLVTNDGATICKFIQPKNELQRLIIDTIIQSSRQTEKEAGDGTSTTILLIGVITKLFIQGEYKHYEFIRELESVRDDILEKLEEMKLGGEDITKDELRKVAYVSANNDKEIADISVDVVTKAGDYGIINIDVKSQKPSVKYDEGFIKYNAIPHSAFLNNKTSLLYNDAIIFITDGVFFFNEDVNLLVKELSALNKNIVVVANKFQAKTPELLLNVQQSDNDINILPLEFENVEEIYDLAAYVGAQVFSKNSGRVKEGIVSEYSQPISKVHGNMNMVVVNQEKVPAERNERIDFLKSLDETNEDDTIKARLASMTSGVVTLAVGGGTEVERIERKLRFDDAILATMKAKAFGYLPGAGSAMASLAGEDKSSLYNAIALANIYQIHLNCGLEYHSKDYGVFESVNANTLEKENMIDAGIFDSFKAVEQSLLNAVSTSIQLISSMSNTIIINDEE